MKKRIKWVFGVFCLLCLLLTARLAFLQLYDGIHSGSGLAGDASDLWNRSIVTEEYIRGEIFDRNMLSMTDSRIKSKLAAFPAVLFNVDLTLAALDSLNSDAKDRVAQWIQQLETREIPQTGEFYPDPLEAGTLLEIERANIPGIAVLPMKIRYGDRSLARHLVGYMNRVDEKTWSALASENKTREQSAGPKAYGKGDFIGVSGLEKKYESWLRGGAAQQKAQGITDASGGILPGLIQVESGLEDPYRNHIVLTLDRNIQEQVESVMDETVGKGAAVVLSVETGNVLAMASRPDFDQNRVGEYLLTEEALISRADRESFYPGSVYKLVTAAAALEAGLIQEDTQYLCTGSYVFPNGVRIGCAQAHGLISMEEAFAQSCNAAFVHLGVQVGAERLKAMGERLGCATRLNSGAPMALTGNTSIGQEGVQISPLQAARLLGTVARGGLDIEPGVVSRLLNHQGKVMETVEKSEASRQVMSPETAAVLNRWLQTAVKEGTGSDAWADPWGAAGKTGTAQANDQGRVIAWFAGYFPETDPRYAAAVMIEEDKSGDSQGLRGGREAAEVFREIVIIIMRQSGKSDKIFIS
jgi:penicillin-binding protein 2